MTQNVGSTKVRKKKNNSKNDYGNFDFLLLWYTLIRAEAKYLYNYAKKILFLTSKAKVIEAQNLVWIFLSQR